MGIKLTLPASRMRAVNTLPFLPGFLVGPTKCEVERFAATSFRHPYVPSCRPDGEYQAAQCQRGGPCWCVDSRGQEIPGTRRRGEPPSCGGCPLQASPPCSRQVMLLYLSLQTDLSRSHSFHCLRGVPHRLFKFNRMETRLSLLISIMFLIPYQTCVLPQGAQRIVRQERIKCTVPQEKRVLTGPGAQGSRGQFYLCLSGEETPRRASWQR